MIPVYSVEDARQRARRALPRILFDFIEGGAGDEITLRANRLAFESLFFRPRMAISTVEPDLRTTVVGQPLAFPIILAPCGGVSMVHPEGQVGVARAAASQGIVAAVSTLCGSRIEEVVSRSGNSSQWFQLYKLGGNAGAEVLVELAESSGYSALVVAIDTPVIAKKERDIRNGGVRPGGVALSRLDLQTVARFAPKVINRPRWVYRFVRAGFPIGHPSLSHIQSGTGPMSTDEAMTRWNAEPATWSDVEWLRRRWKGPLIVKGVLTGADAVRASDAGADAVVVTNHGGRQLDGAPATITMLPEVVQAVPQLDVLVDGGIRRGADVVRALAFGAKAVLVGRPYLYGLALGGEAGVKSVLEVLRSELREAMQLLGCSAVSDLDPSYLMRCE